jgi:hypothetical protein
LSTVPQVALVLFAGAITDRRERRRVLLLAADVDLILRANSRGSCSPPVGSGP